MESGEKLVSGINCSPDTAYNEFMLTKQLHKKTNGRYFYHYCQSFSPNENVSPETVHKIGLELAKKVFAGYETIVGTHIEKGHLHNHIVVNSVNSNSEKSKELNRPTQSVDLTPIIEQMELLEQKTDKLQIQNQDAMTKKLSLLSEQVGKVQDEIYEKTEKGLKKIYIRIFQITIAAIISIISITAISKGCLALLNLFKG